MMKSGSSGVCEIILDNPPVNALGLPVRRYIITAIEAAEADPAIRCIIIRGGGGLFTAGADIAEFRTDQMQILWLPDLVDRIEACSKPVIAAISGNCLGGGMEMVLACHFRIADTSARFALPEVKIGILPGAGGTQRLPRLVDPAVALELMISGRTIDALRAHEIGLVDRIVDGDLVAEAFKIAAADRLPPIRRTGSISPPVNLAEAVAETRASLRKGGLSASPERIVECVAAIEADFAPGRAVEKRLFAELMDSQAARGLQHAFFGERKVARIPGIGADIRPRSIKTVGIVGGGLMGTGIAIALLNAGLDVIVVETRGDARDKARDTVGRTILRDVEKRRVSQSEADARLAALTLAPSLEALADVDLVIEAVFEDLAVKREIFTTLDSIVRSDTILASNTSTLDLDAIAAFTSDPSRVVGLHFFSPANIMRLLEVVRGGRTAPDVLATAMAFARRIGKVGVVSGVCDGFIGNRMFEEYLRQAYFLLEEGALPQQIDQAMEAWGMAMGPLRVLDLAGQDIGWAIRKRRAVEQPDRPYSGIVDRICEMGRFGQKVGKGIYNYADGRTAVPDPEIERLFADYSAEIGLERRSISDAEIVERCLLALINEGARIVGEGIAYRPVDVDMIFLNGYGFARERGGPMFQADEQGRATVLEKIRILAAGRNGWAWEPAALLVELAAQGKRLADLNI
ncbi:MAG: 3-hydroxyacyl-CoA dehydrogenase NAD-binding domain-containing protein [Pseudomonadota bacterium]